MARVMATSRGGADAAPISGALGRVRRRGADRPAPLARARSTGAPAGTVTVEAGRLVIDGAGSEFFTGIASGAEEGSTGDAGTVRVTTTERLAVRDGGEISSDTFSVGDAGTVRVQGLEE